MLRADTQLLQAPPYADRRQVQTPPGADRQRGLESILRNPAIWRAEQVAQAAPGIATGYAALDHVLPDSGWTAGALTELLVSATGTGELSLLLPALRTICAEGRGIALLAPPHLPQARAWEQAGIPLERLLVVDTDGNDLLWSAEQILRSGECGAVLLWGQAAGRALNNRALQRLQLAASTGNALCFLYRSVAAETSPSPAPLRLRLSAQAGGLDLHIVKCRGAVPTRPVPLQLFPAHWDAISTRPPSAAPKKATAVPIIAPMLVPIVAPTLAPTLVPIIAPTLAPIPVPLQPAASVQLCLV